MLKRKNIDPRTGKIIETPLSKPKPVILPKEEEVKDPLNDGTKFEILKSRVEDLFILLEAIESKVSNIAFPSTITNLEPYSVDVIPLATYEIKMDTSLVDVGLEEQSIVANTSDTEIKTKTVEDNSLKKSKSKLKSLKSK